MVATMFSKNGVLTSLSEAYVSLHSIEYTYGFGVYETIRVRHKSPLFVYDHLERLGTSAEILGLEHAFSQALILKSITDLISAIEDDTYNLKILLIGAATAEGAVMYILASNPHYPDKKLYATGVSVITKNFERVFPHAKSLNMLQSYLAYRDAKKVGAYDALLVNTLGCVTEGTRTNFFALKGDTIISPPSDKILLGVTRKHVIEVAQSLGFLYEERALPLSELATFDSIFLTSTSTKIMPIARVDEVVYPEIRDALRTLMRAYDAFHERGTLR